MKKIPSEIGVPLQLWNKLKERGHRLMDNARTYERDGNTLEAMAAWEGAIEAFRAWRSVAEFCDEKPDSIEAITNLMRDCQVNRRPLEASLTKALHDAPATDLVDVCALAHKKDQENALWVRIFPSDYSLAKARVGHCEISTVDADEVVELESGIDDSATIILSILNLGIGEAYTSRIKERSGEAGAIVGYVRVR